MSRVELNGVRLNVAVQGEGLTLLLLHGFTGSEASWRPFHAAWPGFKLIAVDLLGHGASDSPADAARYAIEPCIHDLCAVLDRFGIDSAVVLGYSMGGRVALQFALARPERVRALILESASPGIEDEGERAARVAADEALAASIERDGIEAFVDRWQAQPLFASQAHLAETTRAALRAQRLRNDRRGLANSLRGVGAGRQGWLLPALARFDKPVLLIAGALDARYCEAARLMADAFACAELRIVADAGHTVHIEQPETFASTMRAYLDENLQREHPKGE